MSMIFPLKSRWSLEAKSFRDLKTYTMNVQHDYFNKSISFNVLDAIIKGEPIVLKWIVSRLDNEDEFNLHHIDENGNLLYTKRLNKVKLIGHKSNHDYDLSGKDLQDHEVLFHYESMEVIENIN